MFAAIRDPVGMDDIVYRRKAALLEAPIEGEMVGLDRERGECFGFNESASDVWSLLEQPRTFAELSAAMRERYDVGQEECERALAGVLDEMVAMKLVAAG